VRSESESTEEAVVEIPAEPEEETDDPLSKEKVNDQPVLPRRSGQESRPPIHYGIDDYTNTVNVLSNVAHQVDQIEEPTTIENALSGKYSKEWKAAADLEYSALMDNQTWNLVELPEGKDIVGCKWVFRVKYDGKGEVNHFKGRLVAQGFSQRHAWY